MDVSVEPMDLLNVQSLARGNSGATGMEFNAQHVECYSKTGVVVVCVCVEGEREGGPESITTFGMCNRGFALILNDAEERQSSVRLLLAEFCCLLSSARPLHSVCLGGQIKHSSLSGTK